jgi:hypothetical protein
VQDDADLASVARVDQARRVENRDPVFGGEAGARLDEAREPVRDRDGEPRPDESTLTRPDLDPVARSEVEPSVARIRLGRDDRVVAQALDEEVGHRRVP